jgi:hypothetical protein
MLDWLVHLLRPETSSWWLPYLGIVGTVAGTLMGWGLGFWSRLYFEQRDAKRHRDAIYIELKDVHSALKTRLEAMRRGLSEFVKQGKITALPSEIDFPIYEKWFAEVVLQFTESERLALTHIYRKMRHLNWQIGEQQQLWDVHGADKAKNKDNLRRTIGLMEGAFVNAGILDLMIELLLKHKQTYNIRDSALAARLFERERALDEELRKIAGADADNPASESKAAPVP